MNDFFPFFKKKLGFWGILDPPYCGIGATIHIGQEMLCVPYAGFFFYTVPSANSYFFIYIEFCLKYYTPSIDCKEHVVLPWSGSGGSCGLVGCTVNSVQTWHLSQIQGYYPCEIYCLLRYILSSEHTMFCQKLHFTDFWLHIYLPRGLPWEYL